MIKVYFYKEYHEHRTLGVCTFSHNRSVGKFLGFLEDGGQGMMMSPLISFLTILNFSFHAEISVGCRGFPRFVLCHS